MATRKRVVRRNPNQKTIILEAEREAGWIWGKARGQAHSFADFIRSQGVIGLATGIILGTAVTALVRSLVDNFLNPIIGLVLPSKNLSTATVQIGTATIGWGSIVSTSLDFLLIAVVVYFFFKVLKLEKLDKKKEQPKKK